MSAETQPRNRRNAVCWCGCGRHPFDCPTFKRQRSIAGGRARGEQLRMQVPEKVRALTPLEAYRDGYKRGYQIASDRSRARQRDTEAQR